MATATSGSMIQAISRRPELIPDTRDPFTRRGGFKGLKEDIRGRVDSSSLATVVRLMREAYSEVNPELTVNVPGKDKKTIAARKAIAEVIDQASELMGQEGKLHGAHNFSKLMLIYAKVRNLLEQLTESQFPATYGDLADAEKRLRADVEKFGPDAYKALRGDAELLATAIEEMRKGATSASWNPFTWFKDKSRHGDVLMIMPAIISGLTASLELTDKVSIHDTIKQTLGFTDALNEVLGAVSQLNSELGVLEPKKAREDATLPAGTCLVFIRAKGLEGDKLKAALDALRTKLNGDPKVAMVVSEDHLSVHTHLVKADELAVAAIELTTPMSPAEARAKVEQMDLRMHNGLEITFADLERNGRREVRKGSLAAVAHSETVAVELNRDQKLQLIARVEAKLGELDAKYHSIYEAMDKSYPVVNAIMTELGTSNPVLLVGTAIKSVKETIARYKGELGTVQAPAQVANATQGQISPGAVQALKELSPIARWRREQGI